MTLPTAAPVIAPTTPRTHPLADEPLGLLTQAVRVATGIPDALPREGQAALHEAISMAMARRGHTVGQAPTGSGKSLASLAPAFKAAIERNERTIISTDSLALMGQLQDKDVDTVQDAARALYGQSVEVAFLKGVSNYLDPDRVMATGQALTGQMTVRYGELAAILEEGGPLMGLDKFPQVTPEETETLRRLVIWALREYQRDDDSIGDRHACPVEHSPAVWQAVSASSAEASDGARYGVTAKALRAKARAETAEIVVTNHSILAVQAALGVPVIVGNARLGAFHHIIVDEAHTLPSHVRSQGASKLSGGVIARLGRMVAKAADNSTRALAWRDAGEHLSEEIDQRLAAFARASRGGVRRLGQADDAIGDLEQLIRDWAKSGSKLIGKRDETGNVEGRILAASAKDALDKLTATVTALTRHRSGWARWVEQAQTSDRKYRPWWEANVSPIDVGFLLRDNLWTVTTDDDGVATEHPLSVAAISATMPSNYAQQAGMKAELVKYPSPFTDAYRRSALYVPRIDNSQDMQRLTKEDWRGAKFDVTRHAEWAAEQIVKLVEANGGRALVLSAKAADGRMYAERLRRALPGITVHSQWDGGSATRIVREWRDDVGSVLVGTKSMMTGVDAPGETCSLVIVDRVPRSPSNPIDDARAEQLTERLGDKWAADRFVYAVDAALLLKQAAGRLIRSGSDTGMCVCLDPRLLKVRPLAYPEPTREIYMEALRAFGVKMTSLDQATEWLRTSAS